MKTEPTNIVPIAEARQRREEQEADGDVAPLEAFEPQAVKMQDDDWLVSACDGEQHYVYVVSKPKKAKTYKVTEVYPGLAKKRTAIRDADKPIDLVFTARYPDVNDALEDISDALLGDLELEEGGAVH